MKYLQFKYAVALIGIFFGMSALGGFILGFSLWDGNFLAVACLSAGLALTCYLYWIFHAGVTGNDIMTLIMFVLMSGLALYSNLCWLLWAFDVPINIGTANAGRMGANYWIGPVTLLWAIFCYVSLKWDQQKKSH